jgi:hypothetical protein
MYCQIVNILINLACSSEYRGFCSRRDVGIIVFTVTSKNRSGASQSHLRFAHFPEMKMPGFEIDYSPPSTGEVLNGCKFIFTSHNPFVERYMGTWIIFFSFGENQTLFILVVGNRLRPAVMNSVEYV